MKTCEDCGCRVYEYGCINCNEQDYIDMQAYDDRVITDESDAERAAMDDGLQAPRAKTSQAQPVSPETPVVEKEP